MKIKQLKHANLASQHVLNAQDHLPHNVFHVLGLYFYSKIIVNNPVLMAISKILKIINAHYVILLV